jgi:CBS-domain-containing membrane protein
MLVITAEVDAFITYGVIFYFDNICYLPMKCLPIAQNKNIAIIVKTYGAMIGIAVCTVVNNVVTNELSRLVITACVGASIAYGVILFSHPLSKLIQLCQYRTILSDSFFSKNT